MEKIRLKKSSVILLIIFLVLLITGISSYKIMNSRKFQFFGGIVSRVSTKDKVVALTFDDGPSQKVDEILSILNSENVKATFFLVGNEIKQYPEETKKLISGGQGIGNHTYSHNRMVLKRHPILKRKSKRLTN